jgi:uncharacterized protein
MTPPRHLAIFVKAPRLGTVKRRLAAGLGAVEATRAYRAMCAAALRRLARDRRWTTSLWVTPDRSRARWPARLPRIGQGAGDLGARMLRPFRRWPRALVLVVGSDIPELTPGHVAQAFALLSGHDAVFGPAADGGYWLLGLRGAARCGTALRGVRWSTPHALGDSLAALSPRRVAFAARLHDIDDADAYAAWRRRQRG